MTKNNTERKTRIYLEPETHHLLKCLSKEIPTATMSDTVRALIEFYQDFRGRKLNDGIPYRLKELSMSTLELAATVETSKETLIICAAEKMDSAKLMMKQLSEDIKTKS